MKASEIRREAREVLSGKWGKGVCIILAYTLISFIVGFIQGLFEDKLFIRSIINLAYYIISIPLSFGLIVSFIKLKRNEDVSVFSFIEEGFSRFAKSLGIAFHTFIKLILPMILLVVSSIISFVAAFFNLSSTSTSVFLSLLATILSIASVVWLVCKAFLYVISYYIGFDNPNLSSKECVNKSAEIMKGKILKYIGLQLSFIGWIILIILSFYLGSSVFRHNFWYYWFICLCIFNNVIGNCNNYDIHAGFICLFL